MSRANRWELPSRFKVEKLKYNSYIKGRIGWQNLRSEEFTDEGPFLITGMHFEGGSVDWSSCYHVTEERYAIDSDIHVKVGDVLITKDGSIGKLAYVDALPGRACLNSHLLIIRPSANRSYVGRFLYYVLQSPNFSTFIQEEQTGTTFYGISQESIENFPAFFPGEEEQHAIAQFLDRETARIDELIAKKERLISLLNERSRAVVAQLLTKGSRAASLSPTGADWYGCSPAHWTRARLSRLCNLQRGHDLPQQDRVDGSVPIVSSAGVTGYHNRAAVRGPGVVTGRYGTIGQAFYIEEDFWPLNTTLYVTSFNGNYPKFVKYALELLPLASDSEKSAVPGINRNYIHTLRVAVPPVAEQREIVDRIELHESSIQAMTEGLWRMIDRLREHRTTLISAAVTGQIDVRTYRKEPEAVLETA